MYFMSELIIEYNYSLSSFLVGTAISPLFTMHICRILRAGGSDVLISDSGTCSVLTLGDKSMEKLVVPHQKIWIPCPLNCSPPGVWIPCAAHISFKTVPNNIKLASLEREK